MRRALKVSLGILIVALLASLAVYLVSNTRLELETAFQNSSMQVETDFPGASCRKTVGKQFPFVRLECDPKPNQTAPETTPPAPASATVTPWVLTLRF